MPSAMEIEPFSQPEWSDSTDSEPGPLPQLGYFVPVRCRCERATSHVCRRRRSQNLVTGSMHTPRPTIELLSTQTLRIAAGLRLGVGICESNNCVSCGAPVDRLGQMASPVPRAPADCPATPLSTTLSEGRSDGKRPDGMSLIPWKTGRALVWDATCTDTLASSYLTATTKRAGAAVDARERLKVTKYSCLGAQYNFFAFGVETLGPWGKGALELHRELSNRLREATGNPRAGSFLAQRIAIAVQRGNAACLASAFSLHKSAHTIVAHPESPRSRRSVSQCSCNSVSRRSSVAASPAPAQLPPLNNTMEMYVEPVVEDVSCLLI
ncbi:hypothetical protein MSG28_011758 [Choristoneura fumiferana]|uniref:Uncharacterized protein n=1 Tax=Choristoneura fumiferana TaxID=7141 RepID=A0ACC0KMB5_CHOFU|nr:hypothetical protein MSG28_011758 [Choristoneura fumiferana]